MKEIGGPRLRREGRQDLRGRARRLMPNNETALKYSRSALAARRRSPTHIY